VAASRNPELHPVTTTEDLAVPPASPPPKGEKLKLQLEMEEDEAREEEECL
jgi:hypothetical protein